MGIAKMPIKLGTLLDTLRLPEGSQILDVHMSDDRRDVIVAVQHQDLRPDGGNAFACHSRIDGHPLCWVQETSEWEAHFSRRRRA